MINAFKYGAPPHGGSAPGIDRIVMLLAGEPNIREVVLFPMNQRAEDLMMNAPGEVTAEAAARAQHPHRAPSGTARRTPPRSWRRNRPRLLRSRPCRSTSRTMKPARPMRATIRRIWRSSRSASPACSSRSTSTSKKAIIVCEGWDASGKGGAIQRLTAECDPRTYKVWPIAAPSEEEKAHHYLWRFWQRLPKAGEVAIFDRSWYGRVLVERVEGFASRGRMAPRL